MSLSLFYHFAQVDDCQQAIATNNLAFFLGASSLVLPEGRKRERALVDRLCSRADLCLAND